MAKPAARRVWIHSPPLWRSLSQSQGGFRPEKFAAACISSLSPASYLSRSSEEQSSPRRRRRLMTAGLRWSPRIGVTSADHLVSARR